MIRILALVVLVPGFDAFRLQEKSKHVSSFNFPSPSALIRKALLAQAANLSSDIRAKSAKNPCPHHKKQLKGVWKAVTKPAFRGSYVSIDMGEGYDHSATLVTSQKRRGSFKMPLHEALEGGETLDFHFSQPVGTTAFVRSTIEIGSMVLLHHHHEVTCHFCGQPCVYAVDGNDDPLEWNTNKGSGLVNISMPECPIQDYEDHAIPVTDGNADVLLQVLPLESTAIQFTFSIWASDAAHMIDLVVSMRYECDETKHHVEKIDSKHAEEEEHVEKGDDAEAQEETVNK